MTPAGREPATFRFVAQHLKHCATAVPVYIYIYIYIYIHTHTHTVCVCVCVRDYVRVQIHIVVFALLKNEINKKRCITVDVQGSA